jgi:hypothetical protein
VILYYVLFCDKVLPFNFLFSLFVGRQYRASLYEELLRGINSSLQKLADTTVYAEELLKKEARVSQELRECVDAYKFRSEKYAADIDTMHRMNEEALVAVHVTEHESSSEVARLREEYRVRLQHDTVEGVQQVQQLQSQLAAQTQTCIQLSFYLEHALACVVPLQTQLGHLTSAYNVLKFLSLERERLSDGIHSLLSCFRNNPSQYRSHPHVQGLYSGGPIASGSPLLPDDSYVFEPFLDPLEEAAASLRDGPNHSQHAKLPHRRRRRRLTLRVVVIFVLAARRMCHLQENRRRLRQEAQRGDGSGVGGVHFDTHCLPPVPPLPQGVTVYSSVEITQMLISAMSNPQTAPSTGLAEELLDSSSPASAKSASTASSAVPPTARTASSAKRSLLQTVLSRNAPTSMSGSNKDIRGSGHDDAGLSDGMKNLNELFRHIVDMSSSFSACKAQLEQGQVII